MKIVAINGSPRKNGNTAILLKTVLSELEEQGFETQLIQVGGTNIHGCRGCWACKKNKDGKCICNDDIFNNIVSYIEK